MSNVNDDNEKKDMSNSNDDDNNLGKEVSNMNIVTSDGITRHCSHCLKKVEGSSRCSKCRSALYCNRECQAKHWPVHKNICQDNNTEDSNEKLNMKAYESLKSRYLNTHVYQEDNHLIGNYEKAEKLLKKLLNRLQVHLGESHPDTLRAMNNLAATYKRQGKYKDAEVLLKQCLDKRKVVLGESHPSTLDTMITLARVDSSR